jgi:hypothetical protein
MIQLSPSRCTARTLVREVVWLGPVVAIVGGWVAARTGDSVLAGAVEFACAIVLAVTVAILAVTLPGAAPQGAVIGVLAVIAAMMAWRHPGNPEYTWAVLGVEVVVLARLAYPFVRDLAALPRLGSAWVGISPWLIGAVSGLLMAPKVGAGRVVYGGIAVLTVLALVRTQRRTSRDVGLGVVTGVLLGLSAIIAAGAGNLFDDRHYVPPGPWGYRMTSRFWGGDVAAIHPDGMALAAAVVALRVLPDERLPVRHRAGVGALLVLVLAVTRTRTAAVAAACSFVVVLLVLAVRHRRQITAWFGREASGRRRAVAWVVASILVAVVAGAAVVGSRDFLLEKRYGTLTDGSGKPDFLASVTSGRTNTWGEITDRWRADSTVEQLAGNTDNVRGYVVLASWRGAPKLNPDNAYVAQLRRAGILGIIALAVGLVILFRRVRSSPLWWPALLVGVTVSALASDQLLGGTGTTAWLLMVAGEVSVWQRAQTSMSSGDTR